MMDNLRQKYTDEEWDVLVERAKEKDTLRRVAPTCDNCKYWNTLGHSNRGKCSQMMRSFAMEVVLMMGEDAVESIVTKGDFGCNEFRHKENDNRREIQSKAPVV